MCLFSKFFNVFGLDLVGELFFQILNFSTVNQPEPDTGGLKKIGLP